MLLDGTGMPVRVIHAPPEAAAVRVQLRGGLTEAEHAQALAVVNTAALYVAADQMCALARREAALRAVARAWSLAGLVMARRRFAAAVLIAGRGRSIAAAAANPPPLDAAELAPVLRHGPPRRAGEAMTDLAPVPAARRLERGSPLARAA